MSEKTTVVRFEALSAEDQKEVHTKYADREDISNNSFFKYGGEFHLFTDALVINGEIIIAETHEQGIYLYKEDGFGDNEFIAERKKF